MVATFASGKHALAICDRCGFRAKLRELRTLTIGTKRVPLKVCSDCWEADHPQLRVGAYPISDPQALREPRPDNGLADSRALTYQVYLGAGLGVVIGGVYVGIPSP